MMSCVVVRCLFHHLVVVRCVLFVDCCHVCCVLCVVCCLLAFCCLFVVDLMAVGWCFCWLLVGRC